jgi:hypothetical protein
MTDRIVNNYVQDIVNHKPLVVNFAFSFGTSYNTKALRGVPLFNKKNK